MLAVLVGAACGSSEPTVTTIDIDGRPSAVAVAGGTVFVADDERHTVHLFDAGSNESKGQPVKVERNPVALAADDDGAWVAHASGWLLRVEASTRRVTERIEIGGSLTSVALQGETVWVTDLSHDLLYAIDPKRPKDATSTHIPEGAVRVEVGGLYVWVTGREASVTSFDPATDKVEIHEVGTGPIGMTYADGLWVANSDDGTVQKVGGEPVKVGRGPIGVASLGGKIWAANQDDATVSQVNGSQAPVPIDVEVHPRGIAAADGTLWVVGTNPEALVRVEPE